MKFSRIFPLIASLPLVCGGVAFADDDTGWYIGIGAAALDADFDDDNDLAFDDSDTTALIKGGYMFTDVWGLEAAYLDLGDYQGASGIEVDANAYWLAGVANWSFHPNWDLYGKVGIALVEAKSDQVLPLRGRIQKDDNESNAFGAIGLEYDFGQWNLFGELSAFDTEVSDLEVFMLSLGIKAEF